jgi:hypothetical protein
MSVGFATHLATAITNFFNNTPITSANITDGSILGTDISANTITNSNIANATIEGSKIANSAINYSHLSASLVSTIADISINSFNIVNGSILGTDISNNTITGSNIATGTITGSNIATGTITSNNILDGTILGTDISNSTISQAKLDSALQLLLTQYGENIVALSTPRGTIKIVNFSSLGDEALSMDYIVSYLDTSSNIATQAFSGVIQAGSNATDFYRLPTYSTTATHIKVDLTIGAGIIVDEFQLVQGATQVSLSANKKNLVMSVVSGYAHTNIILAYLLTN